MLSHSKCTKTRLWPRFAPDPTGAYSAPQTPSWFSAGCFAADEDSRQGKGREGKDERDGDGNRRTEIVK